MLPPGRAPVGEACQLLGPLVAAGGRAVVAPRIVGRLLGWNVVEIVLRVLDAAGRRLSDVVVVLPDCRVFRNLKKSRQKLTEIA